VAAPRGRLDDVGEHPGRNAHSVRVLGGPLSGGKGVVVATEADVADGEAPVVGPHPEPFAATQHVLLARFGQLKGLGDPAAPARQCDGRAQCEVAAGRLDDGVRLRGERRGHPDPSGEEIHGEAVVEGDGQERERTGPAGKLHLAGGELVPGHVVAQGPGDVAGQPQPVQLLLLGEGLVPERAESDLQRRRAGGVALGGEKGQPVQEQIAGAWQLACGRPPVRGKDRRGDLARVAALHQPVGGERRGKRLEVGLVRERRLQRLEPFGRLEQQRGSIAATGRRASDLRVHELCPRTVELVQRARLGHCQQSQRRVGAPA
jgi:hypothetical protein